MKKSDGSKAAKIKNRIIVGILVGILVAGLVLLLYPTVANWWNKKLQGKQITIYDASVIALTDEQREAYLEPAQAYNEALVGVGVPAALSNPDLLSDYGYNDILNVAGNGIMGYVTIDKIDVQLPIYHGTQTSVMQVGAGHLEGSSIPIGGPSTHAVISAHRGLPSALLFTRLDEMEVGDRFSITILDQTMNYEVDLISIVEPDELDYLSIEEGKDYVTLMTCTPYGVNTQRLLVRGERVQGEQVNVTAEAYRFTVTRVSSILAIPMVIGAMAVLIVFTRRRREIELEEDDFE